MTGPGTELDVIQELDFEHVETCEWGGPDEPKHGVPAEWWLVLGCCHAMAPLCGLHRQMTEASFGFAAIGGFSMMCATCGFDGPSHSWEPIRGGA